MATQNSAVTESERARSWLWRRFLRPFHGSAPGAVLLEHIILVGACALVAILAWNRFGHTLNHALRTEADHVRGRGLPAPVNLADDLNALLNPLNTGCMSLPNGQNLCVGGNQLGGLPSNVAPAGNQVPNNGSGTSTPANSGPLATGQDQAVFWSRIAGSNSESVASAWALTHGGTTMEQAMRDRGITLPDWGDGSDPAVRQAWENASREFAQGARGNVRVLLTGPPQAGTVFNDIELPTLRNNPNVTSITAVNPYTGQETVLWRR